MQNPRKLRALLWNKMGIKRELLKFDLVYRAPLLKYIKPPVKKAGSGTFLFQCYDEPPCWVLFPNYCLIFKEPNMNIN